MISPRAGVRAAAIAAGVLGFSLLSCGREVTAPQGVARLAGRGMFSVDPRFPRLMNNASISGGVEFQRVRVVLRRSDGSIALDTTIAFPPGADSVTLAADVTLAAGTGNSGENFKLSLGYVNAAGDTVFKGGPVDLTVLPKGSTASPPPPIVIPVVYSGTGSTATSVRISPRSISGYPDDRFVFTAQALDADGRAIAGTPVFWASGDGAKVALNSNLGGDGLIVGGRGPVKVYAQLLTGQVDSATVIVQPRAQRLELVSGDAQSAATGRPVANPLVVRVMASDGEPASGIAVNFAPAGGSVTPTTASTDALGLASTRWTLPSTAGSSSVMASVAGVTGSAGQVTFYAQAVTPRATRLVFEDTPPTTAAGATLGTVRISARDSAGVVIPGTTATVSIALSGGVDTARLGGTRTAPLVDGVATFTDLTVNRVGSGYVLSATAGALASGTSAPFAITEGPATQLRFTSGGGSGVAGRRLGAMTVTAFDAQGNPATQFHGDITMRINVNPGGGSLG
ncbi:MAG: Ig-like domain-containing protein, partial [Gemmatimonadaceae bacterium]